MAGRVPAIHVLLSDPKKDVDARIRGHDDALSKDRPEVSELIARAREIAVLARERARQTEAARRVGEDMIARMRAADLFRVLQPRAHGGFEHGFEVFGEIEAALAAGCGSTGWV